MNNWMQPKVMPTEAALICYQNIFTTSEETQLHLFWSADETAQLYLDGQFLVQGPEKGAPNYWFYDELKVTIAPGQHTLLARVNFFPGKVNYSQMSLRPGFYCQEKSRLLTVWQCRIEKGLTFEMPFPDWGAPPRVQVGKAYGTGEWQPVGIVADERELHPGLLPKMRNDPVSPVEVKKGLLHFKRYVCCRAQWHFQGKGSVKCRWAETPYLTEEFHPVYLKGVKGNRTGTHFVGNFDIFEVDGTLDWNDYTWHAGHYVEVITEGDVTWKADFFDTGYPLPQYQGREPLIEMAVETLRACSHDTFMDCPYYERLLYAADSRLEALALYALTDDHRLAAKTLRMMLLSQQPDGSIYTQYPSRSIQVIPSFMPIFLLSFHDYWERHPQDDIVKESLPKIHALLMYIIRNITDDGVNMPGWQFIDWTQNWENGVPKGNAIVSLITLLALNASEEIFHDVIIAQAKERLTGIILQRYYCPEQQLVSDDLEHASFSEHAQALAILNGFKNIRLDAENLTPCSISFSYYYLCACQKIYRSDLLKKRMKRFKALQDEGLTTLPEEFDSPRSDCHAWGAYIILFQEFLQ